MGSTGGKKDTFAPKGENRTTINYEANMGTAKFVKKKKSKSKVHIKDEEGHFATVKSSKKKKLTTLIVAPVEDGIIDTGEDIIEKKDSVVGNKKSKKRTKHHHDHHHSKKGTDEAIEDDIKSKKHKKKKSKEKKKKIIDDDSKKSDHLRSFSDELMTMSELIAPKISALLGDVDNEGEIVARLPGTNRKGITELTIEKTSALLSEEAPIVESCMILETLGTFVSSKNIVSVEEVNASLPLETVESLEGIKTSMIVTSIEDIVISETTEKAKTTSTAKMLVYTTDECNANETSKESRFVGKAEQENLVENDFSPREDECEAGENKDKDTMRVVENNIKEDKNETEIYLVLKEELTRMNPIESSTDVGEPIIDNLLRDTTIKAVDDEPIESTTVEGEYTIKNVEEGKDVVNNAKKKVKKEKSHWGTIQKSLNLAQYVDGTQNSSIAKGRDAIRRINAMKSPPASQPTPTPTNNNDNDNNKASCEDQLDALATTEVAPVEIGVSKVSTLDEISPINEQESRVEGIPIEDEFNNVEKEESDEDDTKNNTIDGEAKVDNIKKLIPQSDNEEEQDFPIETTQNEEMKPESTLVRDTFNVVEKEEPDEEDTIDGNLLANEKTDTVIEIARDVEDTKVEYFPIRNELNDAEQEKSDEEDVTNEYLSADKSNNAEQEESNEMDTKNKKKISDEEKKKKKISGKKKKKKKKKK